MRILKHTICGYEWEGVDGRVARVSLLGKTPTLTLVGTIKGFTGEVASYKGDRDACQCIALAWVQGFMPGSNRIQWVDSVTAAGEARKPKGKATTNSVQQTKPPAKNRHREPIPALFGEAT